MGITVRSVAERDYAEWNTLYESYANFYKVVQDQAMRDTVWSWLMDQENTCRGLVAESEDGLVGLAHIRPYARPLAASTGGFLDDLYVSSDARGTGAARALIEAAAQVGRAESWSVLRWITADDNYRARALYDQLATKTSWNTYDMSLEG